MEKQWKQCQALFVGAPQSMQMVTTAMEIRWGNSGKCQSLFFEAPKSLQMATAAMKLKEAYSLEEKL